MIVSIIEKVKEYSEKFSKKIPVVVAGGIYERKDMEHVMKLGADGVQMGTRFVTTKECDADEATSKATSRQKRRYKDCTKSGWDAGTCDSKSISGKSKNRKMQNQTLLSVYCDLR